MSRLVSGIAKASLSICLLLLLGSGANVIAQGTTAPAPAPPQQAAPALTEWGDSFDGNKLDETKWERFTFEGGGGGKFEIKDGQLRMRSVDGSRAGVRSREEFSGERLIGEATLAKGGEERGGRRGVAILTVLFDGSGRNRIEWLLTSEGVFDAWELNDGRGD